MKQSSYNDERFNKLSEKINTIVSGKVNINNTMTHITNNNPTQQNNNNTKSISKNNSKTNLFNNSKNNSLNNSFSNNKNNIEYNIEKNDNNNVDTNTNNVLSPISLIEENASSDMLINNLESNIENLEEDNYEIFKDHELKINLMRQEVNYLIRMIQQEKEDKEEIKVKIANELKSCEMRIGEHLDTEKLNLENQIVKMFLNIEKTIDVLPEITKSNFTEGIDLDQNKNLAEIEVKNLKNMIVNNEESNEKEIQELVDTVNSEVKLCNDLILSEKEKKEDNENKS